MSDLVLIFGTRPEALKLGGIAACLRAQDVAFDVLMTGQHTDLLRGTPAETDLAFAESLAMPSDGGVTRYLRSAQARIATWLAQHGQPVVVVQGDTMTAYAGALAAAEVGCHLIHVEAGIRSGNPNEPFPEERFRREITRLADLHLAPTSHCYANLLADGIAPRAIRVTGNPVVSALSRYATVRTRPPEPSVLVTLHRRELTERPDFPDLLKRLLRAMGREDAIFLWPVHPRIAVRETPPNVKTCGPLPYRAFVEQVSRAQAVLTDSGGLCEEAATLGIPTVVYRNVTDRPEAVEAQIAKVVPLDKPEEAVELASRPWVARLPCPVFGGVDSAANCAQAIIHFLGGTRGVT